MAVIRGPGPEWGPQHPGGVCLQRGHGPHRGAPEPRHGLAPGTARLPAPLAGWTPGIPFAGRQEGGGLSIGVGVSGDTQVDTTLTDPAHSLSPGEPVAQKDPREWGPEPPRKAGGVTASSPSLAVCPSLFCALCRTGEQCPQGAPPEGARFSGGVCRGAGSSSGLKGHVSPRFSWWEATARGGVTAGGLGSLCKQEPQVLSGGGRVHGGGVLMTLVGS